MRLILLLLLCFSLSGATESDRNPGADCKIRMWGSHAGYGGRCSFMNEAMTGIRSLDPLVVECSRIEVDCR